ncbi:hypothetical protein IMX07_08465 [bacterium]|nr:hypothetical protein [bacterium]
MAKTTVISRSTAARYFAADVPADIDTPQAIEYPKTLSHDPNREVATSAKLSLKRQTMRIAYSTVKGELIPLTPGYPPAN